MKPTTKASGVNTALRVTQHMNDGMSVVEACRWEGKLLVLVAYVDLSPTSGEN